MKTYNGFLPQSSAEEFRLGDYGYFEGDVWQRLGNIKDLTDIRLRSENVRSGLFSDMNCGASLIVNVNAQANAATTGISTSIQFTGSQGFLQKANIDHFSRYASIPEVERLLKDLLESKDWRMEYKLVACVCHASSFLTITSKSKNATASVNADLNSPEILDRIKVNGGVNVSGNQDEVSTLIKPEDGRLHVSAAKFVHLKQLIPYISPVSIKYMGPNPPIGETSYIPENIKIVTLDELD